jgi:sugar phosphate isomerase/epimerase
MLLGAVTYNILKDWDIEKIIKELEASGFEAVELRTEHAHKVEPSLTPAERESVKRRFERSKVRLLSYGTTAEFHSPDPAVRKKHVDNAKAFIDLAHDTGAWGIKVRPNGLPKEVSPETTIANIGASLRELGEFGQGKGVEIWMEVHGRDTQVPSVSAKIMQAAKHPQVGVCWNCNPTDLEDGGLKKNFDLLRPWIKNVHINELAGPYPYRELFKLLRATKYDRYTLCEAQESKEPERFLRWYAALWRELSRP